MRSALLTGVSGGIGQALASTLIDQGWAVYGTDISNRPPSLELEVFWKGNVAEEGFWENVIAPGLAKVNSLDAFVHNAAVQPCTQIVDTSLREWNETLAVNLTAAFLGTKYLVPLMANRQSAIVFVSSVHAVATSAGMSAYVATKGGLLAFTRAAALELGPLNIRVNSVLPGAVDTLMLAKGLERSKDGPVESKKRLISRTPMKRLGEPAEIAKSIAFLLDTKQSSFLTGQSIVVDGGATAQLSTE
jgi:NAD(P)-dependent dehydrogenase (short-subunit alcohol dehydrogenase family)